MEEIPSSKRMKIEETVLYILKNADLETATEYSVRATASQLLSIDLSDLASKICVREVLESFLLSVQPTTSDDVGNGTVAVAEDYKDAEVGEEQQNREVKLSNGDVDPNENKEIKLSNGDVDPNENNENVICKLSDTRRVAIHDFRKGQTLVSIRDYYEKDGKQFPTGRGITLTGRQWSCFRNSFSAIEETIAQMESRIRSVAVEKQSKENVPSSVDDVVQACMGIDQSQMEADTANPVNDSDPHNDTIRKRKYETLGSIDPLTTPSSVHQIAVDGHQPQIAPPENLVPIMTTRLNGKNYHCWMHQIEFFLRQLKVAYVLTDPCPSIPTEGASFEEISRANLAANKWADDEYICKHSILNSLSDDIFYQYSKKNCSAKELWEELKSVYSEDFGTVRSEVNKYIHFQMVDGVSVLGQIQELNHMASAITASGLWIDENLHVSVIISKLPPSWKEYRAKLMCREFLSLNKLLHLLKIEEESRCHRKKENPSRNVHVAAETKVENRSDQKNKDRKIVCYYCNKGGHIARNCLDRKHGASEKRTEREVQTNTWSRTADG